MKESRYNIFFEVDGEKYVFNSLISSLAKLDDTFEENYKRVLNGEEIDSKLLNNMKKSGVIIEDYFDELDYLKYINLKGKCQAESLNITVAPTLSCNFACPYCYENPQPMFMKDEVMEAILEKVKDTAEKKLPIRITWFGGEPLLAKDIIWNLSEKMIAICEKNSVSYTASMVSNCYLVDDNVIEKMIKYKINLVQVTIDGPPDIHNARRKLKNSTEPTFDRIITNTEKISDAGIKVSIRVNVDKTNVDRVHELIPEFKKYELKNCSVYLGKVVDGTDATKSIASTCFDTFEYSSEIQKFEKLLIENKLKSILKYPYPKSNFCMADFSLYKFVVDGNGNMYKCWHDIGDLSKSVGNILNNPDKMNVDTFQKEFMNHSKYVFYSPFNFKKCRDCNILPLCMGGCPSIGLKNGDPDCSPLKYSLVDSLKLIIKSKREIIGRR